MRPPLHTRWQPGPAAGESGPHLVSFTRFSARRRRELPAIYLAGLDLRRRWGQLEGAVGVWLWSKPGAGLAGSISLWHDEAALRRFVAWPPHVEVVRRYRAAGHVEAQQWHAPRMSFRSHWEEARRLPREGEGRDVSA